MVKNRRLLLFCILIVTAVSYSNVIYGDFQFDDDTFISENQSIKEPLKLLNKNLIVPFNPGGRPLTILTFAFNYAIGGLKVEGYHFLNIIIHLLMITLVYFFVKRTLLIPTLKDAFNENARWLALVTAGIFALHPLQTEAVSYIVQRAESLASIFYLLSLYYLIRFSEHSSWRSFGFWILAMIFFILGWGAKEIIVTVPVAFLLYVLFLSDWEKFRKAIIGMIPLMLIGAIIGIKEVKSFGGGYVGFDIKGLGQPEYFYTEMRVFLTYLRLIFLPTGLTLDHDYPIYREIWNLNVMGSIFFWLTIITFSFYTLRIENRWKWHFRLMGFGILWFLTVLLPTSSLIPLRDVIFEHRVYLAMLGVIVAVVVAADMTLCIAALKYGKRKNRIIVILLTVLLLIALSVATYERNKVWQTKFSLWMDAVKKSPLKSRPHNNLGNCYYLSRDYLSALRHYQIAIELNPENAEAYFNTAITLERLGRKADAVFYYIRFKEIAPEGYTPLIKGIEGKLGVRD